MYYLDIETGAVNHIENDTPFGDYIIEEDTKLDIDKNDIIEEDKKITKSKSGKSKREIAKDFWNRPNIKRTNEVLFEQAKTEPFEGDDVEIEKDFEWLIITTNKFKQDFSKFTFSLYHDWEITNKLSDKQWSILKKCYWYRLVGIEDALGIK